MCVCVVCTCCVLCVFYSLRTRLSYTYNVSEMGSTMKSLLNRSTCLVHVLTRSWILSGMLEREKEEWRKKKEKGGEEEGNGKEEGEWERK